MAKLSEEKKTAAEKSAPESAYSRAAGARERGFTSDYDSGISELYGKITNRQPFSYDYNTDPLYGNYREQYVLGGQKAMKDTLGRAAALTGGYGNSYGSSAGQLAYGDYLARLNEVMPELYDRAYTRWKDEGGGLEERLSLARSLREDEYGMYRDALSDARYADELAYDRGRDDIADARYADGLAYDRGRDDIADKRYADELAYGRERDAVKDKRYADELAYSRQRDAVSDKRYADETAYGRERDRLGDARYADETAYGRGRDDISDERYQQALALQNAETRAQYGDFSGYAEIYGREAAERMRLTWAAANPLAAYTGGGITGEEYYAITGQYPAGYTPRGTTGGGGDDRSGAPYVGSRSNKDIYIDRNGYVDSRGFINGGTYSTETAREEKQNAYRSLRG